MRTFLTCGRLVWFTRKRNKRLHSISAGYRSGDPKTSWTAYHVWWRLFWKRKR